MQNQKSRKKLLLSVLVAAVMLISLLPTAAFAAEAEDDEKKYNVIYDLSDPVSVPVRVSLNETITGDVLIKGTYHGAGYSTGGGSIVSIDSGFTGTVTLRDAEIDISGTDAKTQGIMSVGNSANHPGCAVYIEGVNKFIGKPDSIYSLNMWGGSMTGVDGGSLTIDAANDDVSFTGSTLQDLTLTVEANDQFGALALWDNTNLIDCTVVATNTSEVANNPNGIGVRNGGLAVSGVAHITGGTLKAEGQAGIWLGGELHINQGAVVSAAGTNGGDGVWNQAGKLYVSGELEAIGGNLTEDTSANRSSSAANGIHVVHYFIGGDIYVLDGGKITARGGQSVGTGGHGIMAENVTMTSGDENTLNNIVSVLGTLEAYGSDRYANASNAAKHGIYLRATDIFVGATGRIIARAGASNPSSNSNSYGIYAVNSYMGRNTSAENWFRDVITKWTRDVGSVVNVTTDPNWSGGTAHPCYAYFNNKDANGKQNSAPVEFADPLGAVPAQPPALVTPPTPALTAAPTSSTVLVDGKNVAFDAYGINSNNYFKLRDIAYVLSGSEKQFNVSWDSVNNAILLTSGEAYIVVGGEMEGKGSGNKTPTPTSSKIYLDGKEISFTVYTIEGNNYFKLRDIGKAFDFNASWDGANNTIVIATNESYTED